jgi:hypothetical protein
MPQPSPVAAYLDALSRALAFDPPLCRRVRQEVQDHLREAIDTETSAPTIEDEARAVARFGTPRAIAEQYRALSLFMRMRRTGLTIILAIAAVFVAMKARIAWYAMMQWAPSEQLDAINRIALPIDRYAFLLGAACGIAGWLYAVAVPIPATCRATALAQLRRSQLLFQVAALCVAVAVGIEVFLTFHRLLEAGLTMVAILPAASIIVEAGFVLGAAIYLRNTAHRFIALPH